MNNTIQTMGYLRRELLRLHQEKRVVHVSINISPPKTTLVLVPVIIKHVSAQLFLIERTDHLTLPHSTFQFADLLTKRIVIHELED